MDNPHSSYSDKKYKALMAKAHEGIVLYNHQGMIMYASPSSKNVGGFEDFEFIGKYGTDFVHPDELELTINHFREVVQNPGYSVTFKQRLLHKNGHYIWAETTLTNLLKDPEVAGIISNFRDITSQKLAEDELLESKLLLESINHNIKEAIYRSLPDKAFEYVNQAFLDMFRYDSLNNLNKVSLSSLYVHHEIRKSIKNELIEKNTVTNKEVEFKRKDGSTFWGLISSKLIIAANGITYFDGAIRDITDQKIAEEKLKRSEEFLTSINRNIKEGLYRSSLDQGMIYVNDAFAEIFGYSSTKEILDTNVTNLYFLPETRKEVIKQLISNKTITNKEILFRKKSGEKFWGLMSSYLIENSFGEKYFDGAVRDITALKLSEQKLLELNKTLKKQNNELEQREYELNKAMKELSDRNFELDQLVYKTSHDLRSPLSSILGLVNVAKMDTETSDKSEYIEKIGTSIQRLDEFVKSMLNYAKASRVDVHLEVLDIQKLIENCIKELEFLDTFNKVKTTITINGNTVILTDELKLKIILSNIISNAYKYMDESKIDPYLNIKIVSNSEQFSIEIEDNGIGIEKVHVPKIFDMFYRGTEMSQGSGLGMYIVKQSVDKLGGKISIKSTYGKGTTFKIVLPTGRNV